MAAMITESAMFGDLILRFSRISFWTEPLNRPLMSKYPCAARKVRYTADLACPGECFGADRNQFVEWINLSMHNSLISLPESAATSSTYCALNMLK